MKKTPKKPIKKKFAGPTMLDKLPNNHGEWLELVIKNTIRSIGPNPQPSQQYLIDQKDRLTKELANWRKNENQD